MDFTSRTLSAADYVIFAMMLAISAVIGIFFAIKDRLARNNNTTQFLLAGRSMSPYPVALSLTMGFLSAAFILGTPSEMYIYGTMYAWSVLSFFMVTVISSEIFIPMFYNLGISSVYEYIEMRFHRGLRLLTTAIFMVQTLFYSGVVMYAPALALNAVTGFDLWLAVITTGLICILYCALGGLKAVIWTDVIQAIVMVTGLLAVLIRGSVILGGFESVWSKAEEGGRIIFLDFRTDPRIRHSFWSIVVGGSIYFLSLYGVNQGQVQRYLCCQSLKKAKMSVFLNYLGTITFAILVMLCGLVMYAYYKDCDPISLGVVDKPDQLIPYMVLDIFQNYPGMPGLFMASVFAGSLSTVAAALGALSLVTIQDFIKPYTNWQDSTYTWASKGFIVIYGGLCMLFAYVSSLLGTLLQLAISILGLVGGPLVGVFTLGMIFPFANTVGSTCGIIIGFGMNIWVFIGSIFYPPPAEFLNRLPISTAQCPFDNSTSNYTTDITSIVTVTTLKPIPVERPPIADLYAMSYSYYSTFGFCWTVVVGIMISLITGGHKTCKDLNPKLIYPFFDHWIFKWLPKSFKRAMRCGVGHDDEETREEEKKETEVKENSFPTNGWPTKQKSGYGNHGFTTDDYGITRL